MIANLFVQNSGNKDNRGSPVKRREHDGQHGCPQNRVEERPKIHAKISDTAITSSKRVLSSRVRTRLFRYRR